jgi:large subunit ribosomal protein L10
MKKVGLIVKEVSQARIKNSFKDSNAVFVIKYSGLSSPDMSGLRQTLKTSKANLFVVKNSVARRALSESGLESLVKSIDGPCGIVFAKDEPVSASKALCDFVKDHEKLVLEGGYLQDRVLVKKDIEALAKLPSKDVLRHQVVCALNAPIAALAMTLNQVLVKLVICLDQIKQKKPQ